MPPRSCRRPGPIGDCSGRPAAPVGTVGRVVPGWLVRCPFNCWMGMFAWIRTGQ